MSSRDFKDLLAAGVRYATLCTSFGSRIFTAAYRTSKQKTKHVYFIYPIRRITPQKQARILSAGMDAVSPKARTVL